MSVKEEGGGGYVTTVAAMSWPMAICKLIVLFMFYLLGLVTCFMPKCTLRRWLRRVQRHFVVWLYGIRPPAYSSVRFVNVKAPIKGTTYELDGILVLPGEGDKFPFILIRTPYGKETLVNDARLYAERGYGVLVQDSRGRFGSSGEFFPLENEREDAAAAIDWLVHECEYYDGEGIGVHGLSYNGMCAYSSLSNSLGREHVRCIVPGVSACELYPVIFGQDGKGDTKPLPGMQMPLRKRIERILVLLQFFFMDEAPPFKLAYWTLPLENVDKLLLNGQPLEVYQKAIRDTDVNGEFWRHRNVLCDLRTDTPLGGIHFVGGWYDFFLRQMLNDYAKAKSSGRGDVRLTVGKFAHWQLFKYVPLYTHAVVSFYDHYFEARGRRPVERDDAYPVTLEIIQSRKDVLSYLHLKQWPPRDTVPMGLVMTSDGRLENEGAAARLEEGVVRYHYDPRAPTPAVGGTSFNAKNCGEMLQDDFERNRLIIGDLIIFTSKPFEKDVLIVGNIKCRTTVVSSSESVDIVCRLCRVDKEGHSYNLCDGLERLWNAETRHTIDVDVGSTCVLIRKGERVRLQVTSAAYPRWLRNFNTADRNIAQVTKLGPVSEQEISVGSASVSLLSLPTLNSVLGERRTID
ncbi:conserved hypothetical protein [Perkinsus marinus ATCC 50983]|uniref:Xaa-Pro dipeptidyl-peptidase C-terminal domain-containing protein n=1 Tax=Perkinsus marinus (strain ATCC 50983 / TXsc) TaxID=423536 RepID=C5KRS6_PERM5|nr:conserved hypothetical protein [Perkinsus marinus ATCC 50983]EER12767.1 conserved hypothetical protein [Perkinsus marinus ATCC 50983]|eukprot:XP_002780972.1 conserved hypothetical protein [Perkinsus marinus ATCC 50983]